MGAGCFFMKKIGRKGRYHHVILQLLGGKKGSQIPNVLECPKGYLYKAKYFTLGKGLWFSLAQPAAAQMTMSVSAATSPGGRSTELSVHCNYSRANRRVGVAEMPRGGGWMIVCGCSSVNWASLFYEYCVWLKWCSL